MKKQFFYTFGEFIYRITTLVLLSLIVVGQYANHPYTIKSFSDNNSGVTNEHSINNSLSYVVYKAEVPNPKHVKVFTYFNCPHCKHLHQMIPDINKMGFTVEYFPITNSGSETDKIELKKFACAKDKHKVIDELFKYGHVISSSNVSCGVNPMIATDVAASLKITGTPSFLVQKQGRVEVISGVRNFIEYAKSVS